MSRPEVVLRYVKLPDKLENGKFDQYGHKVADDQPASVVLNSLPGMPPPWQCWGVFDRDLEPGQYGYLIFTNVPGQAVPGGAFTEWHRKKSLPYFDDQRLMVIYSVQRANGSARIIGRNASDQRVAAAAGLLFVAPPGGPQQQALVPTGSAAPEASGAAPSPVPGKKAAKSSGPPQRR
jgi:hypothetical protein